MPELSASQVAAAVGGRFEGSGDPVFADYHFDSRQLVERGLFFALRTGSNDGHRYLGAVAGVAGAGAVVLEDEPVPGGLPVIRVPDTVQAYRDLARHVRSVHDQTRYVGITGSVGKTTTREFASHILGARFRVHQSVGNWNNWQGLPFSLLRMPGDTEVAVFELAMSYPGLGEIDLLAEILRPDITALLNVYPVHLEFLKTLDTVARGKLEINNYLGPDGVALLAGDFDLIRAGSGNVAGRRVLFGRDRSNDVVLRALETRAGGCRLVLWLDGGEWALEAPLLTDAQVENLFAAVLIARSAGMQPDEIQSAVRDLSPVSGRGVVAEHAGWTIIDDTYNANPAAMRSVLAWVDRAYADRTRVAVLGDMLELGADEVEYHREVGRQVAGLGLALLVCVGERSRAIVEGAIAAGFPSSAAEHFDRPEAAGAWLRARVGQGSVVVFKASRGIGLEGAIEAMTADSRETD
jgi:UDP-N-acetylmuramoyl-tripeptide--D-alanyl-D-alanine ligase